MGMFDIVIPECPLPDVSAKLVDEWQTKDFDEPFMNSYRIGADGRLYVEIVHFEDLSEFALTGAGDRFAGCMSRVHERWQDMAFHGVLNFYGFPGHDVNDWYEYDATFTHGQLEKIERVTDAEPVPALPPNDGGET